MTDIEIVDLYSGKTKKDDFLLGNAILFDLSKQCVYLTSVGFCAEIFFTDS